MALIVCPDCQREHSATASSCPGCGRPTYYHEQDSLPTPSHAFPESHLEGHILAGKYRLERMVGRGGMASVYLATRLDLQMPVAVKIISPQIAEEEDLGERFVREARIQFLLQHAGIVRVFDLIKDRGWLGLAMDWIDGDNLLQYLKIHKGPLPTSQIMRLMIPILDAIAHAHQQQVIHRDLKPGNVLLHPQGGQLHPKITDFGIAKVLGEAGEHQTLSHVSLGTPTYMSPEQIEGARDIDQRTDIYSLGVLLFRLATGETPFKRATAMATSMAHLRDPVPWVQTRCATADARLDPVIQIAMAKEPAMRFSDCAAFAIALKVATNDPQPLPLGLQQAASIRATSVEMDLQWITSFADPGTGVPGQKARPPSSMATMVDSAPYLEGHNHTEISGPQARQLAQQESSGQVGRPSDTGEIPFPFAAEDAHGSTGELIRPVRAPAAFIGRNKGWLVLVACLLVCAVGAWFFLRGKGTKQATPQAQLIIQSIPSGAQVFAKERLLGKTPLRIPAPARPEPLLLQVRMGGFVSQQVHWKARRSRRTTVNLARMIRLTLSSKPAGAAVFIDGLRVGSTPFQLQRPPGHSHHIRLDLKGYLPKSFSWKATKDERRLFYLAPAW